MFASQGIGLVAILLILAISGEQSPSQASVLWGFAAGVSGVGGLGCFYLALSRGTMGVVAPIAALIGAGVPVLVAVLEGEEIGLARLVGIGMALLAVVLISLPTSSGSADAAERRTRRIDLAELPLIVVSGLGFAGFFIGIDIASEGNATWWPLTIVRFAGFVLVVGAIVVAAIRLGGGYRSRLGKVLGVGRFRESGRSLASIVPLVVITGAGDLGGNAFFVLARQTDALSVAVVLSSLYPVVTTILAVIFLRERLSRMQLLGVILATLSVPLLR